MNRLKVKHTARLLHMIAADIKAATGGLRMLQPVPPEPMPGQDGWKKPCKILEAEPKLYDAQKLLSLATYVNQIGRYPNGDS